MIRIIRQRLIRCGNSWEDRERKRSFLMASVFISQGRAVDSREVVDWILK